MEKFVIENSVSAKEASSAVDRARYRAIERIRKVMESGADAMWLARVQGRQERSLTVEGATNVRWAVDGDGSHCLLHFNHDISPELLNKAFGEILRENAMIFFEYSELRKKRITECNAQVEAFESACR